ncbi:MAG: hypothetical protein AAFR21_11040 [Pseudomonadota bacterium]
MSETRTGEPIILTDGRPPSKPAALFNKIVPEVAEDEAAKEDASDKAANSVEDTLSVEEDPAMVRGELFTQKQPAFRAAPTPVPSFQSADDYDDDDYDDDDRRPGAFAALLALIAFLLRNLLRLVLALAFVGGLSWAIWKFLAGVLPEAVISFFESVWQFIFALFGFFLKPLAALLCGWFGVFCPADPEPYTPVCFKNEVLVGDACACADGYLRSAEDVCTLESELFPPEPAVIEAVPAIEEPVVIEEPEPLPIPASYAAQWIMPSVSGATPRQYWRYRGLELVGSEDILASNEAAICGADGVAALGVASADNDLGQNDSFGARRADALARAVEARCGGDTPVWRVNLGGYTTLPDADLQRMPMIFVINTDGDNPDINAELGEILCRRTDWPFVSGMTMGDYTAFARDGVCDGAAGWGARVTR